MVPAIGDERFPHSQANATIRIGLKDEYTVM